MATAEAAARCRMSVQRRGALQPAGRPGVPHQGFAGDSGLETTCSGADLCMVSNQTCQCPGSEVKGGHCPEEPVCVKCVMAHPGWVGAAAGLAP